MANRVGDSNVLFGCTDEPYGYVQNMTIEESVQTAYAAGGQGDNKAFEMFNQGQKCSGEFIYRNGSGGPDDVVGTATAITFTDTEFGVVAFYITRIRKSKRFDDYYKIQFDGEYWPNLGS